MTEKRHNFRIPGLRTAAGRELGRVSGDGRPMACRITEPRHWACTSNPERQLTATTAVWEGALITASGKFAFSNAQLHRAQLIPNAIKIHPDAIEIHHYNPIRCDSIANLDFTISGQASH